MNTRSPSSLNRCSSGLVPPEIEVRIEWSPDPEDGLEADGSELPLCHLLIRGQQVEARYLRGGARVLAQALVNLVLADRRCRPSDCRCQSDLGFTEQGRHASGQDPGAQDPDDDCDVQSDDGHGFGHC